VRLTEIEIEKLAARGYAVERGFPLSAVVEAFACDFARRRLNRPLANSAYWQIHRSERRVTHTHQGCSGSGSSLVPLFNETAAN
jgi:hypothetical protein